MGFVTGPVSLQPTSSASPSGGTPWTPARREASGSTGGWEVVVGLSNTGASAATCAIVMSRCARSTRHRVRTGVRPTGPASSSTDSPAAARSACSATATAAVYGPRGAGSLEVTEPSLRSRARMPGGHFAPLHRGDEASHCGPLEPADPLYRRRPDRGRGLDDRLLELRLRSPPIFRSRPIAAKPTTARHMTGRGSEIRELGDEPATGRPAGVRHRAAACAVTRLPRRSGRGPSPVTTS